jgi:hypothetical protein
LLDIGSESERGDDNLVGAVFGDDIVETGILKHLV